MEAQHLVSVIKAHALSGPKRANLTRLEGLAFQVSTQGRPRLRKGLTHGLPRPRRGLVYVWAVLPRARRRGARPHARAPRPRSRRVFVGHALGGGGGYDFCAHAFLERAYFEAPNVGPVAACLAQAPGRRLP